MSDDHGHPETSTKKLGIVSVVNLGGFGVELAGGLMFGSIALMSDAFHMLFDATAYLMAFSSSYMAERKRGGASWSFGYHRLETLSAFLNGALLIPMAGYILWESYQRFLNPVAIGVVPTLLIAAGGLLVNLTSIYFLQGGEMSLNEKGAFYHLIGDAGGSMAVIFSTLIVYFTGLKAADPVTAVLIAGIIVWSAAKVLRGSTDILLQKSPVESTSIKQKIITLDNVHGIKDMRIWSLCSQIVIASVHVCDSSETLRGSDRTRNQIRKILKNHGIDHATIEMEGHDETGCRHQLKHPDQN